jgi:hypothetical protein
MHRLRTSPLARVLALVAGIAVALAPLVSIAQCGCDECVCTLAASEGRSTCCCQTEQPSSCPADGVANDHCTFGVSATGCCCEVSRPEPPAQQRSEQTSVERDVAAPIVSIIPAWLLVAESGILTHSTDGTFHSPSPPSRVLFCVWRN